MQQKISNSNIIKSAHTSTIKFPILKRPIKQTIQIDCRKKSGRVRTHSCENKQLQRVHYINKSPAYFKSRQNSVENMYKRSPQYNFETNQSRVRINSKIDAMIAARQKNQKKTQMKAKIQKKIKQKLNSEQDQDTEYELFTVLKVPIESQIKVIRHFNPSKIQKQV